MQSLLLGSIGLFLGPGAVESLAATGAVLVPAGSAWNYLDTGANPDPSWRTPAFDDSEWGAGRAPLGYGETNIATTVSYGPDADVRYITTYFRRAFVVDNPEDYDRLYLEVLRDDGVAVYLNGTEVFRNNLSSDAIDYLTLAVTNVYGAAEGIYATAEFRSLLVPGINLLAAEVHQAYCESDDLIFDLRLSGSNVVELTRGPYVQMGTPGSMIIRWRTTEAVESRVSFGTAPGSLYFVVEDPTPATEHEVLLTELEPGTKYYYAIGTTDQILAGGPDCFFHTAPAAAKPTRVWVTGDTRSSDANEAAVRDAYYQFNGARYTDVWLMLGDNGGDIGTDAQFQVGVFDMFPATLRQTVLWPAIGNHDAFIDNALTSLQIFSLPADAEAGGIASGTERYFSFNYGRIHFVVLDSVTSDISTNGPMYAWLARDLAANTSDWLIAYWHYPPYTKGSHDSDSFYETGMTVMRENFVPLLEAHGVDLVLCGHSHVYERSFLLDGHYGYSWELQPGMILNGGDGRSDGDGAYLKPAGLVPHRGAVYAVVGCSGMLGTGSLDHPAMFVSEAQLGSLVLDIDGNTLHAMFLRETGDMDDEFTIIKGAQPLRISSITVQDGTVVLTWNTRAGTSYSVRRCDSLGAAWTVVDSGLIGDGTTMTWTDTSSPATAAFYRIEEASN